MSYRTFFNSGYIRGGEYHKHPCRCGCSFVHCFHNPCPYPELLSDFEGFEWRECLTEYIERRRQTCGFCNSVYYETHRCDSQGIIDTVELRIQTLWRKVVDHMILTEAETLVDMILKTEPEESDKAKVARRLQVLLEEHKKDSMKVNGIE